MRVHKIVVLCFALPLLGLIGVAGTSIPPAQAGTCCSCEFGPPEPCSRWLTRWNPTTSQYVCFQGPLPSGTACTSDLACVTQGTCNGSGSCVGTHGYTCKDDAEYHCSCAGNNCTYATSEGLEV